MLSTDKKVWKTMDKPKCWAAGYELPERPESEIEDIYEDLICSLFHQPDEEAEKIKYQYLQKYSFLDKERIKLW
jgi:hypothetical protein